MEESARDPLMSLRRVLPGCGAEDEEEIADVRRRSPSGILSTTADVLVPPKEQGAVGSGGSNDLDLVSCCVWEKGAKLGLRVIDEEDITDVDDRR